MRFAIRPAVPADTDGIVRVYQDSWRDSYRALLPPHALRIDDPARRERLRQTITDPAIITVVAYDISRGDIVGFCDAGANRGETRHAAELYRLYLDYHAKRHGLGTEMFELVVGRLRAQGVPSLVVWVLDANDHACRFYEAMGGRRGPRIPSRIAGVPIIERSYVWDPL